MPFKNALDYTLKDKYDIAILGMRGYNYGNQLTVLALYNVIIDMGKSVLMLDRPYTSNTKPFENCFKYFRQFPYPEYAIAESYTDKRSMSELNNRIGIFLLPSDQVLRSILVRNYDKYTLMDWVRDDKPKIAYSSSFGTDYFEEDDNFRAEMGFYLNRFDAISVREESGVEFAKINFGVDVEQVLDPIFLCDPNILIKMTQNNNSRLPVNPFLGCYILDPNEQRADLIENLLLSLNYDRHCVMIDTDIPADKGNSLWKIKHLKEPTVEEFLACILNCDFFITDSFHGICIAIIFRKQFIVIYNEKQIRGSARIRDILKKFNLEKRLADSYDKIIDNNLLADIINYDDVYKILNSEITRSRTWLENTINNAFTFKKNKTTYDIFIEKTDILETKIDQKTNVLETMINELMKTISRLETENQELENRICESEIKILKSNKSIQELNNYFFISLSRIWLFRKAKGLFRNIKEKGFFYTFRLFIKKIIKFFIRIVKK
jgi:hypothetical protein